MKNIYIFTGIAFYAGSILDTRLHEYIFVLWAIAYFLSWAGWSFIYASILLVANSSYEFMSIESSNQFTSSVLPWIFGVSFSISLISLLIKYNYFSNTSIGGGGGGCGSDGGGGDC